MHEPHDREREQARQDGAALARRHARVAMACTAFVVAMVGMSFAAVPLYDLFCRVTGFGGTPRVASEAPDTPSDRRITVRFDANVAPGLGWRFAPESRSVEVALGETRLMPYAVKNEERGPTVGTATYNVSPPQAGYYFVKMQCFCFTEQHLDAGEQMDMPVAFYVDPAIENDPELGSLRNITLSYTFFPSRNAPPPQAAKKDDPGAGQAPM